MKRLPAEQFTEVVADHGEGPVWLGDRGLGVLDMLAGDLVLIGPDGEPGERIHVDDVLAAVRPRRTGGLVAGTERGFCLLDENLVVTERITCWPDPAVRMNDGSCDPRGRFWCGSMAYDLTPGAGALWCLDGAGVSEAEAGIGCSNGLGWTQDGTRAYYVDSLTRRVDLLETEAGGVRRRPFADLGPDDFPDGLAVDQAGGLWLALFGSGRVVHLDSAGRRDAVIELPVAQPTACAFGGPDFSVLYITTSRYGLPDPEPGAGAIFTAVPEVGGFAPYAFAG